MTDLNLELSIDRTRLLHERTMMSWVRTATSLISFGFSIYKFFQLDTKSGTQTAPHDAFIGPRRFALLMIGTGLVSLLLATVQNEVNIRKLSGISSKKMPISLATWVAALVSIVGILAFITVFYRE